MDPTRQPSAEGVNEFSMSPNVKEVKTSAKITLVQDKPKKETNSPRNHGNAEKRFDTLTAMALARSRPNDAIPPWVACKIPV
jgi:hypothetical protein